LQKCLNTSSEKITRERKKYAAWIDKFSGLLPMPEDKLKNEKQWRLLTTNSTHRVDELLIEMDMPHMHVEHNVSESYLLPSICEYFILTGKDA
jgi:hypothetical protein